MLHSMLSLASEKADEGRETGSDGDVHYTLALEPLTRRPLVIHRSPTGLRASDALLSLLNIFCLLFACRDACMG